MPSRSEALPLDSIGRSRAGFPGERALAAGPLAAEFLLTRAAQRVGCQSDARPTLQGAVPIAAAGLPFIDLALNHVWSGRLPQGARSALAPGSAARCC